MIWARLGLQHGRVIIYPLKYDKSTQGHKPEADDTKDELPLVAGYSMT